MKLNMLDMHPGDVARVFHCNWPGTPNQLKDVLVLRAGAYWVVLDEGPLRGNLILNKSAPHYEVELQKLEITATPLKP